MKRVEMNYRNSAVSGRVLIGKILCIKPVIPTKDKIFHFQNIRLSALFK